MKLKLLFFTFLISLYSFAQIPAGYYNTATGTGYTLKTQLYNIIKGHTDNGYDGLYTTYLTSDRDYYYENDGTGKLYYSLQRKANEMAELLNRTNLLNVELIDPKDKTFERLQKLWVDAADISNSIKALETLAAINVEPKEAKKDTTVHNNPVPLCFECRGVHCQCFKGSTHLIILTRK